MRNLFIQEIGAFTSIGTYLGATIGSLRVGYSSFGELPIVGPGGKPVCAARSVVDNDIASGAVRMLAMSGFALRECAGELTEPLPLVLCGPSPTEVAVDFAWFCHHLAATTGIPIDVQRSVYVTGGHAAISAALAHADHLLASRQASACYVAGADTFLDMARLKRLIADQRILGKGNSDGFIPGEAAVFLRVTRRHDDASYAWLRGIGMSDEASVRTSGRVSAAGLTRAAREALSDARATIADVALTAVDVSGERPGFYELAVTAARLKPRPDQAWSVWNPALCVGDVGAALGPLALAYLAFMLKAGGFAGKTTSPNGAAGLYLASSEEGLRGAVFASEVPRG
jgi:3-oxoacyl-[acyl-carrier-protein] synthase-1